MTGAARGFGALAALALVAGFVAAGPSGSPAESLGVQDPGTTTTVVGGATVTTLGSDPHVTIPAGGPKKPGELTKEDIDKCAQGKNDGATAPGVTATKIRLASTVVLDGPAASLLSSSPTAMQAVINKVNRAGGICGRQLSLEAVNDSFDAQRGGDFIRSFIDQKYFALPVVPSAEGLSTAIAAKLISRAGIPVVGTDGMRQEQYEESWVWPVATATASTMRIIARYGREKINAKTYAIVYDNKYKFGLEGAEAFIEEVEHHGGKIVSKVQLNPDQQTYNSEVDAFNRDCGNGKCDIIAMLLLPDTARAWMAGHPQAAGRYTAAAQTLFSERFAQQCVQVAGQSCHGINVWTGYNPPIGTLRSVPGIATYINDVQAVDPRIDVQNQFVQGAYLGMNLLVEALRRVGPNLTRDALRQVLDQMTYETDLAPPLTWRPNRHHANGRARAFSMVVAQGTFTGWRDEQTGFIVDPALEGKL